MNLFFIFQSKFLDTDGADFADLLFVYLGGKPASANAMAGWRALRF